MMDTWLAPIRTRAPQAVDRIAEEARAFAARWGAGELGEANAVAYVAWHHLGHGEAPGGGFVQLQRFAVRAAGGDQERGTDAAIATWLDVRERLDELDGRLQRGASVPDFRQPSPDPTANCWRYHRVQARLRVHGKWSHRVSEVPGDVDLAPAPPSEVAEARTHAVQLHFAAWWYLLSTRPRRTRSGRTKGPSWWWSMLEHALQLADVLDLGSDRNDPTEAMHRLRLRFAACLGLGPWLRRWAAGRPYWQQLAFTLPDPDHPARHEVADALDTLHPLLATAIAELPDADTEERQGLAGCLLSGWNVRTTLRRFRGDTPPERWQRMLDLAMEAAMTLSHPNGRPGRQLLDELATAGSPPTIDRVTALAEAVRDDEVRESWVARAEAEPYLAAVVAMPSSPAPARRGWFVAGGLVVAGAVALLLWVPGSTPTATLRGGTAVPEAYLDLTVAHPSGEVERLSGPLDVGDRVYFQLAASEPASVQLWVQGPEGSARLVTQEASAEPTAVGTAAGALYYTVEQPGTYVFSATPSPDGACEPPGCDRHVVEVR